MLFINSMSFAMQNPRSKLAADFDSLIPALIMRWQRSVTGFLKIENCYDIKNKENMQN